MSYCLNPVCQRPQNPSNAKFCQTCGSPLLLGDRYRAVQLLGGSQHRNTFLAVDEFKPSRPACVIKQFQPPPGSLKQGAADALKREADCLDTLGKHPQIPELLAYFSQNDRQYLVQELIEGLTLAQELEQQGLFNEAQIRQILQEVLPILEFIHDRKVVHRNLKPETLIRRRSDRRLFLVGFGTAKTIAQVSFRRSGTQVYGLGYAAPEQERGRAVFSSDLYSLGVTCLYLITQIEPFHLYSHNHWVWRDFLRQPISEALAQFLDRLIAPQLFDRYTSATEALRDLQQLIATIPAITTAIPTATVPPSFLEWLLGGMGGYLQGNWLENTGNPTGALAAYDRALQANPKNEDAWYRKAQILEQMQQYPGALESLDQVVQLHPSHAKAWFRRGVVLYSLGQTEAALTSYDQALKFLPHWPVVWLCRSAACRQLGKIQDAKLAYDRAQATLPPTPTAKAAVFQEAWEILIRGKYP